MAEVCGGCQGGPGKSVNRIHQVLRPQFPATTATSRRFEDALIKALEQWKSLAYLEYVRIPRLQLATFSSLLY